MNRVNKLFLVFLFFLLCGFSETIISQKLKRADKVYTDSIGRMVYRISPYESYAYKKPKTFDFLKHIPGDFVEFSKQPFKKKNLPEMGILFGSTALLVAYDQPILDATQQFGLWMGINPEREFKSAIRMGEIDVLDIPDNFNTVLYFLGEGWPSVMVGLGYFTYGSLKKDYRALQTASQLAESFISMGITTQLIKRITGRESPFTATQPGGVWRPFPNPKVYQNNVPHYDAFPSGHLATVMATITILSHNYPEHKIIKPIGYSVMGLVAFSMIHNDVHWISDYPLAIAIGYTFGKIAVERNREVVSEDDFSSKNKVSKTLLPVVYNGGAGLYFRCKF